MARKRPDREDIQPGKNGRPSDAICWTTEKTTLVGAGSCAKDHTAAVSQGHTSLRLVWTELISQGDHRRTPGSPVHRDEF